VTGAGFGRDYPAMAAAVNLVEPAPRRVRGVLGGHTIVDTTSGLYVWEWANYPQYYLPVADFAPGVLVDEDHLLSTRRGPAHIHGLRAGDQTRPGVAKVFTDSRLEALNGTVHIGWDALDAWYEEDEQVFVHPRNPYVRVDALRSTRKIRVELDGIVLAESSSPVLLFETGLPTRYYLDPTDVDFDHLRPSPTVTECPYKGVTSGYWSVQTGDTINPDLAWVYNFPLPAVSTIRGLIAFYNEKVDIIVDGRELPRPRTHYFA
jgi:uncharacterized protein (DUF427 family)